MSMIEFENLTARRTGEVRFSELPVGTAFVSPSPLGVISIKTEDNGGLNTIRLDSYTTTSISSDALVFPAGMKIQWWREV